MKQIKEEQVELLEEAKASEEASAATSKGTSPLTSTEHSKRATYREADILSAYKIQCVFTGEDIAFEKRESEAY